MKRSLVLAALALGPLSACWASEGQLRQRAAADFQCDPDKLAVAKIGGEVHEVSGCDQKERYVFNKDAGAWVRESEAGGRVIR